jgi:hypothetical protein
MIINKCERFSYSLAKKSEKIFMAENKKEDAMNTVHKLDRWHSKHVSEYRNRRNTLDLKIEDRFQAHTLGHITTSARASCSRSLRFNFFWVGFVCLLRSSSRVNSRCCSLVLFHKPQNILHLASSFGWHKRRRRKLSVRSIPYSLAAFHLAARWRVLHRFI